MRAFDVVYLRFLREIVLPNINDPNGILFQTRPTFRCHIAGGGAPTGRLHCDAEYGHQSAEINYWLPLTQATGTNSLYAESQPGKGDFSPFELQYGECQRFWGARCMHYTEANDTDITRVSIDFRVVPRSEHVPDESRPDGLKWKRLGLTRPESGVEFVHAALSDALSKRTSNRPDFNATELQALGVEEGSLRFEHFVQSTDGWYFSPLGYRFEIGGFYGVMEADGKVRVPQDHDEFVPQPKCLGPGVSSATAAAAAEEEDEEVVLSLF